MPVAPGPPSRHSPRLAVMRAMQRLAASSYGPAGCSKIVQAGEAGGALTVTTTSHRLFGALCLDDPVAKVLQQLLTARQERGADGGLLTIMLAAGLVLGAAERGLPARLCAMLLPAALTRCVRAVLDGEGDDVPAVLPAAVAIRMSDLPCLLAIVRAVLRPKHVAMPDDSDEAAQRLALLLVEAFVTSLTDAQAADGDHQTQALTSPSASDQLLPSPAERRAAAVLPGEREPTREVGVRSSERPPASRPSRQPRAPSPPAAAARTSLTHPPEAEDEHFIGLYSLRLDDERANGQDETEALRLHACSRACTRMGLHACTRLCMHARNCGRHAARARD